ncbi:Calx-beta domain-containing protein [Candidatus Poriferisodalis sp.]|uniref:Calx-beta domain-containing protein n=1 Tax=Candidatus Poriferisodalis sp. TaxID=3101277 RepID=UPI003B023AC7
MEVSFGSGSYSVLEGSTVTVTVSLSAVPEREVVVLLSAAGLGGADAADFSGVPSDVTFAADETSQQFVFTATGDSVDDDNESVRLSFGTLPAGVTAAAPVSATVAIVDDDVPAVEVSFGSGSYSVSEGSTVTVTVSLSAVPEREVVVLLSAAGLGGADAADFSGVPSDVTFAADETSQQFVFTATGDSVDDDNESVRLSFGTLPAGVTAAAPVSATVAIVDDDVCLRWR